MLFATISLSVVIGGWCLCGFYSVGAKLADMAKSQLGANCEPKYYSVIAFILTFLAGPIGLGFWKERYNATLLSALSKSGR